MTMNQNDNDVVVGVSTNSTAARSDIRRLERSIQGLESATRNVKDFKGLAESAKASKSATDQANNSAAGLAGTMSTLTGLAVSFTAAIGAMLTLNAYHKIADEATLLKNRLRLVNAEQNAVIYSYERLYKIARNTRSEMTGMGDLYYRMSGAAKTVGKSQEDVFAAIKAIQMTGRISGSSPQSAAAAMTQLNQAMASGTLRGEELNSVMEQLPRMAEAIAAHMGTNLGGLRKLAEGGLVTSEVVFNAMLSQSGKLASEFATAKVTAGEGFQQMTMAGKKFVAEIDDTFGLAGKMADRLLLVAGAFDKLTPTIKTAVFEVKSLLDSAYLDIVSAQKMDGISTSNLLKLQTGLRKARNGDNPFKAQEDKPSVIGDVVGSISGGIQSAFEFPDKVLSGVEQLKLGLQMAFHVGKSVASVIGMLGTLIPTVFGPAFTLAEHVQVAGERVTTKLEVMSRAQRSAIADWVEHKIEAASFFTLFDSRIERGFRNLFRADGLESAANAVRDISEALDSTRGNAIEIYARDAEEAFATVGENVRTALVFLDLMDRRIFAIHNIRFDRLIYGLGVVKTILSDLYSLTIGRALTMLANELSILGFRVFVLAASLVGYEHDFLSFVDMFQKFGISLQPAVDMVSAGLTSISESIVSAKEYIKGNLSDWVEAAETAFSRIAALPSKVVSRLRSGVASIKSAFSGKGPAERLNDWLVGDGGFDSIIKRLALSGIAAAIVKVNVPLAIAFSILTMDPVRKALVPVLDSIYKAVESLAASLNLSDAFDAVSEGVKSAVASLKAAKEYIAEMFSEVLGDAAKGLEPAWAIVSKFASMVERAFFWVFDRVVGHSWWPDLIDGVVSHAKRLNSQAMGLIGGFTGAVNHAFKALSEERNLDLFSGWMESGDYKAQIRKQLMVRYAAIALTMLGMPVIGVPLAFVSTESGREVASALVDSADSFAYSFSEDPLRATLASARMLKRELTGTTSLEASVGYIEHKIGLIGGLLNTMGAKFSLFGGTISNMSFLDKMKSGVDSIKEKFSEITANVELSVDAQAMLGHIGRILLSAFSILFGPIWLKALSAMSLQDYVESYVALPLVDSFEYIFGTHLPSLIAEFVGNTLGSIGASVVNTLPDTVAHVFRSLPTLSEAFFGQFGGIVSLFGSLLSIVLSGAGALFNAVPGTGLLAALLFGHVGFKAFTAKDKIKGAKDALLAVQGMFMHSTFNAAAGPLKFNKALMRLAAGVGILSPMLISSVSALDGFAAAMVIAGFSVLGGGGVTGQLKMAGAAVSDFTTKLVRMAGLRGNAKVADLFKQLAGLGSMVAASFESNRARVASGAASLFNAVTTQSTTSTSSAGTIITTRDMVPEIKRRAAALAVITGSIISDTRSKLAAMMTEITAVIAASWTRAAAAIAAFKATAMGAFVWKSAIATAIVLMFALFSSAHAASGGIEQVERAGTSLVALAATLAVAFTGLTAALSLHTLLTSIPKAERSWKVFAKLFIDQAKMLAGVVTGTARVMKSALVGAIELVTSSMGKLLPMLKRAAIYVAYYIYELISLSKWLSVATIKTTVFGATTALSAYANGLLAISKVILGRVLPAVQLLTGGLLNLWRIGGAIVSFFTTIGAALTAAVAVVTGLVAIAIFGKGDNILEKIKNLGIALKEAIFPAAKAWKEAVPDRKFGAVKFEFANRIDTLDIPNMGSAEKTHFERVNTRVGEVMQQTQEFYDTQGYLTQEQEEAAQRAYAEWQRVYALSGRKNVGVGGLVALVEEAQSIRFDTVTNHLQRFYTGMSEVGAALTDTIGLNTALGKSVAGSFVSLGVWLKDSLFALITAVGTVVEQIGMAIWDAFMAFGWIINKILAADFTGAFWLLADTIVSIGLRLWLAVSSVWTLFTTAMRPLGALFGMFFSWISAPAAGALSELGGFFGKFWDAIAEGLDLGWRLFRGKGVTQGEALKIEMANGIKVRGSDGPDYAKSSTVDQLRLFESFRSNLTDADVKLVTDATLAYTDAERNWRGTAANDLSATKSELADLEQKAKSADEALLKLLYEVNQRGAINSALADYNGEIDSFLKRLAASGGEKLSVSQLLFGGDERASIDQFVGMLAGESDKLKTMLGASDETAVPIRVNLAGLNKARNELVKLYNEIAFFDGQVDLVVKLSGWELTKSQMEDLFVNNEERYNQAVDLSKKLARLQARKSGMGASASREERVAIISDIRAVEAELAKLKPTGVAIAAAIKEALSDVKADNFSIGAVDIGVFEDVQRISEALKNARDALKKFEEGQKDVNAEGKKLSTGEYQAEWNRLNNSVLNFRNQLSQIVIPDVKLVADSLGSVSDGPAEKVRMMSEELQAKAKQDAMEVSALQNTIAGLESKGSTMTSFDRDNVRSYQKRIQDLQGKYKKTFEAPKKEKKEKKDKEYKNIFERFTEHFKKNGQIDIKLEDFGLMADSVQKQVKELAAKAQAEFNKLDQKDGFLPNNPAQFREALARFNKLKNDIEDTMKRANFDNFWASISKGSGIDLSTAIQKNLFGAMNSIDKEMDRVSRERKDITPEADGTFTEANLAKLRKLADAEDAVLARRVALTNDNQTVAKQLETVLSAIGANIEQVSTEADANKLLTYYNEIVSLQALVASGKLTPADLIEKQARLREITRGATAAIEGELVSLSKLAGIELSAEMFDSSEAGDYIALIREAGAAFKGLEEAKKRVLNGVGTDSDRKAMADDARRRRREANMVKRMGMSRSAGSLRESLGINDEAFTRLGNSEINQIVAGRRKLIDIEEEIQGLGAENLTGLKAQLSEIVAINEAEAKLVAAAERYKEVRDSMTSSMTSAMSTAISGESGKHLTDFLTATSKTVIDDFAGRLVESWLKPISEGFGTMLTKHGASFSKMIDQAPSWLASVTGAGVDKLFGAGSADAVKAAISGATDYVGSAIGSAVDGIFGSGTASSWMSSLFGGGDDASGTGGLPEMKSDGSYNNPFWVRMKNTAKNKVADVPDFDMFGSILKAGIGLAAQAGLGGGATSLPSDIAGPVMPVDVWAGRGLSDMFNSEAIMSMDSGLNASYSFGDSSLMGSQIAASDYGSIDIKDYLSGAFDTGGIVPGTVGSAQLALVHGGETILPTHKKSIQELNMAGASGPSQSIFNINVTGDISRQTRRTIIDMIPTIAGGVNASNQESGKKA